MTRWVKKSIILKYIDFRTDNFESIEHEIENLNTPEYSRVVGKVRQYNLDKIFEKYNQLRRIPLRHIIREEDEVERRTRQQSLRGKDLEAQGCKVYVCPNLKLIDARAKELNLHDTTIEKAKDIAREYFKKTYHHPKYSRVIPILAACLYMASIIASIRGEYEQPGHYTERRAQYEVTSVFGFSSQQELRRWFYEIKDELDMEIIIS